MRSVKEVWGLACPACGSDERLYVVFESVELLIEHGAETVGTPAFNRDSACWCGDCNHSARARDFEAPDISGAQRRDPPDCKHQCFQRKELA